jgi:uncharacterized protein with HEPN domain
MSYPDYHVRLRHMLDAAQKAVHFSQGHSRSDLDSNEVLALALVRLLEIIGEAAKSVPPEVRQDLSEIQWWQITGTRDRLAHGYFDVDLDVVWAIITNDLPQLIVELNKALSQKSDHLNKKHQKKT